MFRLQKTRKTIPVAEVPTGKRISIWGKTLTPAVNFSSYSPPPPPPLSKRWLTEQSTWDLGLFIGVWSQTLTPLLVSLPRTDLRSVKFRFIYLFIYCLFNVINMLQMSYCFIGHLQWVIGELACYTYSMVVVPLYDTLGPEALVFIIDRGNWVSLWIQFC